MEHGKKWKTGKWDPDHNGFCMSFWELEMYPEDAKGDSGILIKRMAWWNFYFRNIATRILEDRKDGGQWTQKKKFPCRWF